MAQDGRILAVGAAATDLDIFITAGQNGDPINASGITFEIFDPQDNLAVTTTSGTLLRTGVYSASGAIIPAGFTLGEDWRIVWDVVLPGGTSGQFSETFCVALPSLAASFAPASNNNVESVFDRVRIDLGDPDGKIFSDGLLRRTMKKAVTRLNRRLGLVQLIENTEFLFFINFNSSVRTPVLEVDLINGTITPDTDPYVDILVLQLEEILLTSELVALGRLNASTAGPFGSGLQNIDREGVSATNADGVSISVSTGRLQHRRDLGKFNVEQISKEIEHAVKDFRWRLAGAQGRDVTRPRYWGYGHYGYGGYGGYY